MKYGALDSLPRQTTIGGQPHMLAYINPEEEGMIQDYRGNLPPVAGPDGVPAYFFHSSWGGGSKSTASTSSKDDKPSFSISNVFSSIGNGISSAVSSVVSGVSDFVSDVGQAAGDTIKEVATLGAADTQTYNTTENNATQNNNTAVESVANFLTPNDGQTYVDSVLVNTSDAIDATVAANEGSSYSADTNSITGADGSTIGIGTNVNADDITDVLYSELLPGGSAGSIDDFNTRFNLQSIAAELDPQGGTTATGFLVNNTFTSDMDGDGVSETYTGGTEYTVNLDGSVVVADSEGDTTGGLSLLGQDMIDLGLADPLGDGVFADGSGMTDLTQVGGGSSDGVVGGGGLIDTSIVDTPIVDTPIDGAPKGYSTDIFESRDIMGDFYGGRSGGMWDRFSNSYLTRFGYSPEQFNEMVRKVENPDGSVNFFGADGQLINPESLGSNYRLTGDPTSLKIGEEQVVVGQQNYDAAGNLLAPTVYEDPLS
jgi:hypothetical protein